MTHDERITKIADNYGLDSQLDILQEECAELIVAVSKFKRGKDTANIIEEIADVEIMLDQIVYLLDKKNNVDVYAFIGLWIEKKIRRQLERMSDSDAI